MDNNQPENDRPTPATPAKGVSADWVIAAFLGTGGLLWGLTVYAGFTETELYDGAWAVGFMALLFTLIGLGSLYLELKPEKTRFRRRRRSREFATRKMTTATISSSFSPARITDNEISKASPSASPEMPSASAVVAVSVEARQAAQKAVPANSAGKNFLEQELLPPARANVAKLVLTAGEMIGAKLDVAGISRTPSFDLVTEDMNSTHVTVKGYRPDAKTIENLINSDPKLQMAIHNVYALANHVPTLERSAAFSRAYTAAQSQMEIDRVIIRYSDLLSGIPVQTDIGLSFDEDGLTATINGETVHT